MEHQSAVAISKEGLDLIKKWEGFRSTPYKDAVGVPTIGYGSTFYPNGKKVRLTDPSISQDKATEMLRETVKTFEDAINVAVTVPLRQNQFDALCSLAYNIGAKAFKESTLVKLLNKGDEYGAATQFVRWNKAGGKELRGLTLRRRDERDLFIR